MGGCPRRFCLSNSSRGHLIVLSCARVRRVAQGSVVSE